jgi:FlaA1/EpsC-like NDP-sugar epimerase
MQDLTGCEGHVPRVWENHSPARTIRITWLLRPAQVCARIRRHGISAALDCATGATGFILADVLRFGPAVSRHLASITISWVLLLCLFGVANYGVGLHRRIWRYANLGDVAAVGGAVTITTIAFSLIDLLVSGHNLVYWLSTVPNGAVLAFLLLLTAKIGPQVRATRVRPPLAAAKEDWSRVLIVGAGATGTMLAHDFQLNHSAQVHVVGFVDDDASKTTMRLNGLPVLGTRHDIARLVADLDIDLIAIAIPSGTGHQIDDLFTICQGTAARVQIVSSLGEMATQGPRALRLRELDIADLLGRDEVHLDLAACAHYLEDRVVLVTGATGSIGSELCRQLLGLRPRRLVLLDTNESGLFDLEAHLQAVGTTSDLQPCIADIADEERIGRVFDQYRPQVVFHAAGYKHVPLLETHPREAIKVNAFGTAVLCRAADASGVERFVFISSDKAVAAVNNLGYSKRIGELLMRAYAQGSTTIFCAVRFGNVIGSRGSVVRTFERQIAAGGPVTVTHPQATRFFMSTAEAACLVIEAAARAAPVRSTPGRSPGGGASGSIFMLDMGQPVPIVSLAEKMIRLRGLRVGTDIALVFTGLRPGDKLHEDLICAREHTVPTAHAKIRSVIDRRPVSRPEMEALVRSLFLVSRCADRARVSEALRAAAQGEPLPLPAAGDGRRPAGALLGVALEPVHDPLRAPERGAWAA